MSIHGMPAHPLLVHAVVVLLPLAAVALALHAVWPSARHRLGIITPVLALAVLVLVPVTTNAGEDLAERFGNNPLVRRHEELADQVLPWAIALFVAAALQWWWNGPGRGVLVEADGSPTAARRWTHAALGLASLIVAVGATIVLVRAGDAGARAVWGGAG